MWLQNISKYYAATLVQLVQRTTQERLFTLLLNILNCLMDNLRFY